jgi:hypothetical protein
MIPVLLAACGGGGGGGGGNVPPLLTGAVWSGSGPQPAPGDALILFLSEPIRLGAGAMLDGTDLQLSSGSLGTVTQPPVLFSASAVQITLGPGVALAPGGTTVAFQAGNDAVFDLGGAKPVAGVAQTITSGDGVPPVLAQSTVESIDDALNGDGPAGGRLRTPPNGFTLDLGFSDANGIDHARTVLRADQPVATGSGTRAAGTNLVPDLTAQTGATSAAYTVPGSVAFPTALVTLTAQVFDATGMASAEVALTIDVRPLTDSVRPFETSVHPSQLWYLNLGRDLESYSYAGGSGNTIAVTNGANGRADFDDLLLIVGLHGADAGVNATVTAQLRQRLTTELQALYPGVNVTFTFNSPGTFPGGSGSVPYASLGWSQICVAGAEDPADPLSGVLGVALFDPNNATQNDNCLTAFGGGQRLGVFLHTVATFGLRPPSSSSFRVTFDPFVPGSGGTPVGNDAGDAARLAGSLADARRDQIDVAIRSWARVAAVITAHECGHSVGLVKNGAMPVGLYGGDPVHFPGSTSGHIRNSGFPSGATNVMSPSLSFDSAQHPATAFNRLNLAYLRERVHHDL